MNAIALKMHTEEARMHVTPTVHYEAAPDSRLHNSGKLFGAVEKSGSIDTKTKQRRLAQKYLPCPMNLAI